MRCSTLILFVLSCCVGAISRAEDAPDSASRASKPKPLGAPSTAKFNSVVTKTPPVVAKAGQALTADGTGKTIWAIVKGTDIDSNVAGSPVMNGLVLTADGSGKATWSPISPGSNLTLGGTTTGTFSGNGAGLTGVNGAIPWVVVSGTSQQAASNTGYIASNAAQVTITLPASPAVGDIVRVTGAGAGGWRIAQNADQSITLPLFMATGTTWIPREGSRGWSCVASSSDGTKLVATVFQGQIFTSTDSGATWTPRESNRGWACVASSSDGTKLVAGITTGQIYTSTDSGVTWTPRESSRGWQCVASSSDGTKLVAGAFPGQIYTSTDSGVNWTPRDSSRNWASVASSSDGTKLVADVFPSGQIYTSTDSGANWTPRESNRSWTSVASSSDGSKLVAGASGGQIYTSIDSGVTWTPRDSTRAWYCVASSSDGTKLVAGVQSGQIYTSTDSGATWTARDSNRTWYSVASSSDGSKVVSVVSSGQIYTASSTAFTTPGATGSLVGTQFAAIELQYIGNGQFIPLSSSGTFSPF